MELRKGMKFNYRGNIIELSYYDEDNDGCVTWIDTKGNNWGDGYILSGLKSNDLQLISYPYEVGDYIKIIKDQHGSAVGSIVKITVVSKDRVWYLDPIIKKEFIAALDYIRPASDYEINNIKKQKEMKETKFKVGDWVKITKSDSNWNSQMDKFDGQIVQITSITSDNSIRFENDGTWQWEYKNNHFVKADSPTKLLSPEEQEYLLVGYATVPTDLSITTPSVNWSGATTSVINYPFTYKDSLEFVGVMSDSSSPTISIIKPKNKKSMFRSDIVSFK
jgi:hypothetical protein